MGLSTVVVEAGCDGVGDAERGCSGSGVCVGAGMCDTGCTTGPVACGSGSGLGAVEGCGDTTVLWVGEVVVCGGVVAGCVGTGTLVVGNGLL